MESSDPQKFSRKDSWIWRCAPRPTVFATVELNFPNAPPAAEDVNDCPG